MLHSRRKLTAGPLKDDDEIWKFGSSNFQLSGIVVFFHGRNLKEVFFDTVILLMEEILHHLGW